MSMIPSRVVEKILLNIPNSKKHPSLINDKVIVLTVNYVVVIVPKIGMSYEHLCEVLELQLEMGFWMIDYILGQNDITP
jgi:hypothetical protein